MGQCCSAKSKRAENGGDGGNGEAPKKGIPTETNNATAPDNNNRAAPDTNAEAAGQKNPALVHQDDPNAAYTTPKKLPGSEVVPPNALTPVPADGNQQAKGDENYNSPVQVRKAPAVQQTLFNNPAGVARSVHAGALGGGGGISGQAQNALLRATLEEHLLRNQKNAGAGNARAEIRFGTDQKRPAAFAGDARDHDAGVPQPQGAAYAQEVAAGVRAVNNTNTNQNQIDIAATQSLLRSAKRSAHQSAIKTGDIQPSFASPDKKMLVSHYRESVRENDDPRAGDGAQQPQAPKPISPYDTHMRAILQTIGRQAPFKQHVEVGIPEKHFDHYQVETWGIAGFE